MEIKKIIGETITYQHLITLTLPTAKIKSYLLRIFINQTLLHPKFKKYVLLNMKTKICILFNIVTA